MKKTKNIIFRVTEEQRKAIAAKANKAGMTVSAYLLEMGLCGQAAKSTKEKGDE